MKRQRVIYSNWEFTDIAKSAKKRQWQKRLQNSMDLIHKLPENLSSLQTLLEEELEEIIWLQPVDYRTPPFASAAYPEVPGKIF